MADPTPARTDASRRDFPLHIGILGGGLAGALLLLIAEFTTLFDIRVASSSTPVSTIATGSHHAYALVPIAGLAAVLTVGVWRTGSRPALLAIGLLGVAALLIALIGDLPDAHASGLLAGAGRRYEAAAASPGAGLYVETLGAVLLIITCSSGFILFGPPAAVVGARTAEANGAHG